MIAVGILSYMEANPPPDHSGELTAINNRIDALETRFNNMGINFQVIDIDGTPTTANPQWVKNSQFTDPITDENLMTHRKSLRD